MRKRAEDYYTKRERLGAAILASDKSFEAIGEIMRGEADAFWRMDRADNYPGVPEWHMHLRRWRNGCRDCFDIMNDKEGE
jgi:hypothetical protein